MAQVKDGRYLCVFQSETVHSLICTAFWPTDIIRFEEMAVSSFGV